MCKFLLISLETHGCCLSLLRGPAEPDLPACHIVPAKGDGACLFRALSLGQQARSGIAAASLVDSQDMPSGSGGVEIGIGFP
jgi:hypothetical protein